MNDYYEEPIALIEHDGFCEGGQLLVGDDADARKLKAMEALYSDKFKNNDFFVDKKRIKTFMTPTI